MTKRLQVQPLCNPDPSGVVCTPNRILWWHKVGNKEQPCDALVLGPCIWSHVGLGT